MSKVDTRKKLNGVYRRCLSALNQSFKIHNTPSAEKCKRIEAKVAEEANRRVFGSSDEYKGWVKKRFEELYQAERLRLLKDPNASLKAQIRAKMV